MEARARRAPAAATAAAGALLVAVALLPGGLASAALPTSVEGAPVPSLAPMIRRVSPAVVNIATRGTIRERGFSNPLFDDPFFRRFFDVPPDAGVRERQFQSAGSGVIVDAKAGYVLTNAHVVANADEITVTLQDGRDLEAKVVGSDAPSDVAVLRVPAQSLTQIALGDSTRVEVGDFVVAIGNPFGLQHTVTSGIVSGLGRSGINPDGYEDFIQTDASINPGNSGGALVNLRGELIGINSAILSQSGGNIGIGFAIPMNLARSVMDQLIRDGRVHRGQLGVDTLTLTPDVAQSLGLARTQGALVRQVAPGSPAAKAGLRAGDVVTAINGTRIRSNAELRNSIGLLRVGERVDVALLREGKPLRVTVTIADPVTASAPRPGASGAAGAGEAIHRALAGATLVDHADGAGVLIRAVQADSAAARSGLRAGDVIRGVGRQRATNLRSLRELSRSSQTLQLTVERGPVLLLFTL